MPKKDLNQLAKYIVDRSTGEVPKPDAPNTSKQVASKGGKARAEKLSPEERKKIAANAAKKRWG